MMNVQTSAYLYMNSILSSNPGVKVLLLDKETLSMVSVAITKTELFEKEVVLVEQLSQSARKTGEANSSALNCIILCRPTAENVEFISKELDHYHYQKYNIYFTNATSEAQIRQIASHDTQCHVESVKEVFLDFYALNSRLFSLEIDDITGLRNSSSYSILSTRIPEGLFAYISSQRVKPVIRFDASSKVCQNIAQSVSALMEESRDIFSNCQESATVLILDRRSDPVVPLLHLWYYCSALHDLFTIKDNVISISERQYVLNERTDQDSQRYSTMYLGDLAPILSNRVDRITNIMKDVSAKPTDLSDFHQKISAVSRGQLEKVYAETHISLFESLHSRITRDGLMELSALEQIVATVDDIEEQSAQILEAIESPKTRPFDALRLVLIFALRYEKASGVGSKITAMMGALEAKATWTEGEMKLLDGICSVVGDAKRGPEDLFSQRSLLTKFTKGLRTLVVAEKSQYELYRCLLESILAKLRDGKLSMDAYPAATKGSIPRSSKVIVFYVGGVTYEEMRIAEQMSQNGLDVVVGGTTVHNAESFIRYEISPYC